MLVVNKAAIHLLPVPSLVLLAQLAASALFVQVAAAAGMVEADAFERDKARAFFPAVCGFLAVLFCNAKLLAASTVETFIVVRSTTPLVVAVLDWRFMGRELPDARSTAVLLVIFLSALAYVHNVALSVTALAWALAWLGVFVRAAHAALRGSATALTRLVSQSSRRSTSCTSNTFATRCRCPPGAASSTATRWLSCRP